MFVVGRDSILDKLEKRGENEKGYNLIGKLLENLRSTHLVNPTTPFEHQATHCDCRDFFLVQFVYVFFSNMQNERIEKR